MYNFTEEQLMIKELAHRIAIEKIKPVREKYDHEGIFPSDIVEELAKSDLFRVFVPAEYDGMVENGLGITNMCIVTEELSKVCGGIALAFAGTGLGIFPILLFGTDDQKKKYFPQIASGKKLAAFGLTEPNAGSDAAAIQTTARKDGVHYILNGSKVFITNGGEADIYTILALTNPEKGARGASMFIVEKGMPGFEFGKKEDKMGIRGSATAELIFNDCKVPAENLLGKKGAGFLMAMRTFDISRPGVAAQALGIAEGALEETLKYAHQRHQFGKSIISNQGIQWMLADMATEIEAAKSLIYDVAGMADSGMTKNIGHFSAMAKMFASDVAMKVTTDAVQIFGGYGYMREYPVEKMMRDAKITQIYEGTNQIQRNIIGTYLAKLAGKLSKE
ncbi:acyl-CoA dehydrogenase family protein [bacterium]|nr:acyl-CoA dehydrogenase family protein [bacterium]